MKKSRTKNKLHLSARKFFMVPKRKILPFGVVVALIALVGTAGLAIHVHKANVREQAPNTPVSRANTEKTTVAQESSIAPAPVTPAPSTVAPQTSASGPGPTTGNAYKLNKDGQMPTVSNKRLIVSPTVVTYDGRLNPSTTFTVSTEDGRAVSMPSGSVSGCCFVVTNEYTRSPKSSWNVFLDMWLAHENRSPDAPQSYVVPLQIIADDGRGNEIRYTGSVTVVMPPHVAF